jgi:hypothetical protein
LGVTEVYQAVSPVFQSYGVPDYIWQSIAHMETGGTFDVKAVGDSGRSFGLFQLFTDGGQGDAYAGNGEALFDPTLNAQIAAPEIARAYHLGRQMGMSEGPQLAAWVAANSGHPGYGLPLTDTAVSVVGKVAPFYYHLTTGVNPNPPAPGEPGGGPVAPVNNQRSWIQAQIDGILFGHDQNGVPLTRQQYAERAKNPVGPDSFNDSGIIPGDLFTRLWMWATRQSKPGSMDWASLPDNPVETVKETVGNKAWWTQLGVWLLVGALILIFFSISLKAVVSGGGEANG